MGSSRDPSPITPDTIRSTAEQLPDQGVSADSIRSTAEQLPEAPSIDPDSIRSVAERLPGESAPEDTGFMDQLAGIALAANPKNFTRTVAEDIGETYQEDGLSGVAREAGGAVQDVLSQAGKQFFRGRSQQALDRARFILSEETSAATEPRRRIAPSTSAAPLQGEAAQAAARDAVQRAEELQERAESFAGAPAVQEVTRQMQQGDFAGAFQTMQEQPSFLPALGIGTMAQQPVALAATSGLMAGVGAVAPAGLATTLATGTAGAGGSFLTADIVEGRAELARSLREAGADVSDTDDVLTKLQDPEFRREVEERVDTRVASIGTVDALANLATMGMASSGMARPVTALLGAGGEIAAEGAGEATAQYMTRGEISPADVALESLAGAFGPATVEAGTQVAASGDGQAAQARQTSDLVEQIRQRAEEVQQEQPETTPEPGPAEEVPAGPQRPLADMDDDALENAREEALSAKDLETVQLIDEELSLRKQESAIDGADGDDTAQSDRAGERRPGGQGQNNRPTQRRGASREQPPARPNATPEAEASLRALDAVEQARQQMQRREQARQELGLGQVPEDPAPDVDARVDDTDTDEQGPEQSGREGGDREGARDSEDEPGAAQADEVPADERGERGAADEGRRRGEAGAQGELDEDMGLRPDTRPEEQVDEAVEEAREQVRSAEEELRSVEEQIQGALRDSDPETIQRLAEQTSSDRVRQQLEAELARRQEQGDIFGGGAQEQGGQAGDLFGQGAAESTSGLERLVRRLEQREAGVEQARQELLRREQQQADRRQQAREAQQSLDVESDEQSDETDDTETGAEDSVDRDASEGEVGATQREPGPQSQQVRRNEGGQTERVQGERRASARTSQEASQIQTPQGRYVPPTPDSAGELVLPAGGRQANRAAEGSPSGERITAVVTDEAVQATEGATPETLRRLADEAAQRDKALETSETVSQENAQALYRLAQDGYEVTRAPSATQSDAGVTAEGEPAFRVRAPRFDQTRPTTETNGVTVGRAAQSVTRLAAQSARSDAFADTDTAELRTQLEEAIDSENEQAARRLQSELDRRQNPPTQTTYRHREGDLVVVDEDGRFLDARSGERYYEAVAEYFAANEQELRAGVVEPRTDEGAYARTVARSSGSPQQVLEVYNTERARGEEAQDPVVRMMDATRYSTSSFDEYADPNWRQDNGQLTMEWLGGDKSLDARAQEITEATGQETTPQDIVEHITENPQGPNRRSEAQRLRDDLEQRFEELTGITLTPGLTDRIQSEQVEDLPDATDDVEGDPDDPFTPTGDAPFQRMAEQDGRRPAADLVEVYLRKIAANLGAPITVVDTPAGLEGRAAEAYERGRQRAGQDFSQPAMFLDGEVYVIASDVEANARAMGQGLETFARQTVMHEAVAHKGLRELLGDEFAPMMDALFESIGRGRLLSAQTQDGTPLADAYAPELETSEDGTLTAESRQLLVEEYLARLAEDMAAPESVVQQIFRRVRDAIQRVFGVRITETDLRLLLEASRDHLRGAQQRNPVSSTRFSRQASGSVPAARWMMVGSRATDFEQAQDEGRTFQGLDEELRFEISDAEAQFAEDGPLWNFVTGARKAKDFTQRLESADDPSEDVVQQAEDAQKKRTVAQASLEEGVALEDAIAHDQLFEQYPDLRDVVLEARPMDGGAQASYNPSIETITLNLRRLEEAAGGNFEQAAAVIEDVLQSVLHEVQHAVQHLEGFSQGDSPNRRIYQAKRELDTSQDVFRRFLRARDALSVARMVENTGRDLEAAVEEQVTLAESDRARTMPVDTELVRKIVQEETPGSIQETMKNLRSELKDVGFNPNDSGDQQALQRDGRAAQRWQQRRAHNLYRRTSGEVEARLTAERRDVPQEERITETEELRRAVEYDPEEVIVRYSRQREDPNQLGLFHDPESGDSGVPGGKRNMVTLHNLDPQNIRFAVQQMDGYLPVPSLATVRYEDGFAQFGDITLLGDPELVDPESGTPTFGGDAYTPTTPGPAYEGDVDAWLDSGVQEQIEKWSAVLDRSDASGIYSYVQTGNRRKFYSMLTRAPAALMAFREAQGEQILARDLPRKPYDGFMGAYLLQDSLTSFLDGLSDAELNRMPYAVMENNEAHDPQLASDVTSALEAAVQEHAEENFSGPPERRQEKAEVLLGAHLSEDGRPSFNTLDRLRRSYLDYKGQDEQPVDTGQVREDAKARVQEHVGADSWREAREEMEAYWRDKVDPFSGPRMPSDTSEPYNLYNIVERMRERGVRAAEGSGINFLRAIAVEQFGTIEEVQAMRDRLTSREEYKQAAARLEDDFKQLWKNLKRSHEVYGLPDTTPRRKALEQAIADYVPRRSTFEEARNALSRSGFESVPAGDVQAFMGFVEDLRSEPVQYFESKPQRAVALEEFEAAIVPDDLPSDVREQLGETVGRVAEYEAGSDADRQQTLAEESARADVRFQRQGRPSGDDLSANPNARWKRVFHGSPYDFEAFDTSEVGSGEGAQAFGWGLYFTEEEAIAEHYAESVTQQKRGRGGPTIRARIGEFGDVGGWAEITQFAGTTPNQEQRDLASAIREGMRRIRLNEANPSFESEKVLERAIEGVENDLNPGRFRSPPEGDRRERIENTLETLRSMAPEDLEISGVDVQPTVYTVEMHGGREPSEYNYVQWRKEGDGAKIANALWDYRDRIGEPVREEGADFPTLEQELVDEIVQGFDGEAFVPSIPELSDDTDATGGEVYRMLGRYMKANAEAAMQEFNTTDHQEAVSKLLLRAGIDGIKYEADQGRADAFNYTVFDDKAVEVAEKVRFQRQQTGEGEADAGADVPPNPNAFTQDWSIENLKQLATREWRRWFEQRSLLPESVWQAKMERDGALAAGMERVRYALRDFGHALEQAYDTQDPGAETARRLNEALQNGYRADVDPEQAELFAPEEEPVAAQEAPAGVVTTSEGNQIELFGAAPPTSPAVTAPERQTLADMTFIEDLPGGSPPDGSPSVREAVSTLRDHIDALTALGLKAGLWKGELRTVVTENLGTYVTRSYKVHHEEDYGDTVKQAVREYANEDLELDADNVPESLGVEADTWNRAVTAMRNLHPGMSNERVLGELFGLLTTDEEGGLYQGGSKLGSVGQSIYERRKDIPSPLRDLMGEYKEPGQNYLRSMNKMLRAVTSQKFLNQVKQAGLGEWLRREPTVEDGTEYTEEIAAEGSRTMAPLNGLYTTKEIKQAFETFDQPATLNKAYRWYMRAAGTVKEMLTKYSLKLQVRNLTSAFGFGISQGHMFDEGYLDSYATAFPTSYNRVFQQEDTEAQRELTQKLLRLQVLDEAPRIGDIEETWRDAGAMMEDPLGDGIDTVWEKYYRQADQYATRAYQAGDNVHKIAGFLIEKARYADAYPNRSEQEIEEIAARRVRDTFPTYSLVPKGIRRLRRNPLASSFPSFFAEIVRNRANTLRLIKEEMQDPRTRPIAIKRAAGEMVNASIWAGVAYGGMALAGVDDEFDDYFRRHLPSWEKYSYLFYYPSEEGKQSFVDIGYLNPNATFHEPVLAALGGEEVDEKSAGATAAYRFLAPFVSPEILTQSVAEAAFNESYENGGPIYNPELPPAEKAEEAAKHIAKDFTPGVLEQANDIRQSFAADQEGYGEDAPTKLEALASPFLGQSMRTVEADNSWKWKTINLQSQYRDAGSIWYQALTERGSVSRSELEERYRTSLQRKQELVQKAHKDLIGAELMGLSEQEAYSIMDAQGAADALKADVMAGRFRPRPDFNILSGRIQSERQSGNEEDAKRLQERAEVAREIMQEVSQEFRRPSDEDAAQSAEERLSNSTAQQP